MISKLISCDIEDYLINLALFEKLDMRAVLEESKNLYFCKCENYDNAVPFLVKNEDLKRIYEECIAEKEFLDYKFRNPVNPSHYTSDYGFRCGMYFNFIGFLPHVDYLAMRYPYGTIVKKPDGSHFFRGENSLYKESIPTLCRKLKRIEGRKYQELYRVIADMRIFEFSSLLKSFRFIREWNVSSVLIEPLAQHYGLETPWLDITTDFLTALFFATCYWDKELCRWQPLNDKLIAQSSQSQYGIIFHVPRTFMKLQSLGLVSIKSGQLFNSTRDNIIWPFGYQPFRRCEMQDAYGIYMRNPNPLQNDFLFEKIIFKQSKELSRVIFEKMEGGNLIYPTEGFNEIQYLIDYIANLSDFSEEALDYALYRNHFFLKDEKKQVVELLHDFHFDNLNGVNIKQYHSWNLPLSKIKSMNEKYSDVQKALKSKIKQIKVNYPNGETYLHDLWMLTDNDICPGAIDFRTKYFSDNSSWFRFNGVYIPLDVITAMRRTYE